MSTAMRAVPWFTLTALAAVACSEGSTPSQPSSPTAGRGGVAGASGAVGIAGAKASGGLGGNGIGGSAAGSGTGGGAGGPVGAGAGTGGGSSTGGGSAAGHSGAAGSASAGAPGAGSGGTAGSTDPGGAAGEAGAAGGPVNILVFSKTGGYRHESIPVGIAALTTMANTAGWQLTATEDAGTFTDSGLSSFDVLLFLSTTEEVLNDDQQAAFERYVRIGKGFVGIHGASDTEFDWPFYGELVGAYFKEHPDIQQASITVEDTTHPITAGLPATWTRTDEWYGFETNPRSNVHVLLSLDESSYSAGTSAMGGDHPIAWLHEYEGTRVFYTALGHTAESYSDPLFLGHVSRGIAWAAGR